MKINFNISLWAVIILIGIVLALIYSRRSVVQSREATISALDSITSTFDVYRLRNDTRVSEQNAVILEYQDAINIGLVEIDRLNELNIKKVNINIRLKERIRILEAEAQYDKPPVIVYRDTPPGDTTEKYIQVPFGFRFSDEWAYLHAVVDDVPVFDTIVFWSYPEITVGWQKQGFLKKKERKVIYTNANPYVYVVSMENVVIEETKKWWQTDVAKVTGGIVAFEVLKNLIINQ